MSFFVKVMLTSVLEYWLTIQLKKVFMGLKKKVINVFIVFLFLIKVMSKFS